MEKGEKQETKLPTALIGSPTARYSDFFSSSLVLLFDLAA
jgi:hypothetical protein